MRNGGSFNFKPQRGGRAYVGHLIFQSNFQSNAPLLGNKYWSNTPHFAINTILIKVILIQIALTRAQNANQNPQSGDAIDDQIPHICPPPSGA